MRENNVNQVPASLNQRADLVINRGFLPLIRYIGTLVHENSHLVHITLNLVPGLLIFEA